MRTGNETSFILDSNVGIYICRPEEISYFSIYPIVEIEGTKYMIGFPVNRSIPTEYEYATLKDANVSKDTLYWPHEGKIMEWSNTTLHKYDDKISDYSYRQIHTTDNIAKFIKCGKALKITDDDMLVPYKTFKEGHIEINYSSTDSSYIATCKIGDFLVAYEKIYNDGNIEKHLNISPIVRNYRLLNICKADVAVLNASISLAIQNKQFIEDELAEAIEYVKYCTVEDSDNLRIYKDPNEQPIFTYNKDTEIMQVGDRKVNMVVATSLNGNFFACVPE